MAEPLILAYGRGELPEFPASADTVVDIVPVDHVVAAIVAVLAHPPEPGTPAYFHVSSGDRNPLTFRNLYYAVRDYFEEHPFVTGDRGAVRLPDWRFPGAQAVERLLSTSERAHKAADYVLGHVPARRPHPRPGPQARPAGPAAGVPAPLPRPLPRVRPGRAALRRLLDPGAVPVALRRRTSEAFAFDTAVIDWDVYLKDIHCPAVTAPIRKLDERRMATKRPQRNVPRAAVPGDGHRGVLRHGRDAAVLQRHRGLPLAAAPGALGRRAARPARPDRHQGAEHGAGGAPRPQRLPAHRLPRVRRRPPRRPRGDRRQAPDHPRALPPLPRRRAPGPRAPPRRAPDGAHHRRDPTADPAARPALRPHRGRRAVRGRPRGLHRPPQLTPPWSASPGPPGSRVTPRATGSTSPQSFAYADSHSDLPLLAAVGNPVAVRPDVPLFRHARRSHWTIVDWASPDAAARPLNPAWESS